MSDVFEISFENLRSGLGMAYADRVNATASGEWIDFTSADCFEAVGELEKIGISGAVAEKQVASAIALADLCEAALADTDLSTLSDREAKDGSPIILSALVTNGAIENTDKVKIANSGGKPCLCAGRMSVPIQQDGDVFTVGGLKAMGIQSQQEKGGKTGSYWSHQTVFVDDEGGNAYVVRLRTKEGIKDQMLATDLRSGKPIAEYLDSAGAGAAGNLKTLEPGKAYKVSGITVSANPYKQGAPRFTLDLDGFGRFYAQKGAAEFLGHFCDPATMQFMDETVSNMIANGLYLRLLSVKKIDEKRSSVECDLRPEASLGGTIKIADASQAAFTPAKEVPAIAAAPVADPEPEVPAAEAETQEQTPAEEAEPAANSRRRPRLGLKKVAAAT